MKISMDAIRELRERTGAAMMACKQSLEAAHGDVERAVASLRELGLVQAKKREEREVNEGRIFLRTRDDTCVLLKLGCETDFVARNSDFIRLGENCLAEAFAADAEVRINDLIADMIGRIRENIVLKRLAILTAGPREILSSYVHDDGRIGVAIKLAITDPAALKDSGISDTIRDLSLHVAAFAPQYLSREDVDSPFIAEKTAAFTEEVKAGGKPAAMVEKIVQGKLDKLFSKICLLEQPWIRDDGKTVGKVLEEAGSRIPGGLKPTGFLYDIVETSGNAQAALQYMRQ